MNIEKKRRIYKEAKEEMDELYAIMKDVHTIEEAKEVLKKYPTMDIIEVNGLPIYEFYGNENIDWFRVEYWGKHIMYAYFYTNETVKCDIYEDNNDNETDEALEEDIFYIIK